MESTIEFFKLILKQNGLVGVLLFLFVLRDLKVFERIRKWKNKDKEKDDPHPHRRKSDEDGPHYHQRCDEDSKLLHQLDALFKNYVSEEKLRALDLQRLVNHFSAMQSKIEKHLEREVQEDIEMGVIKNEVKHLGENQEKTDENVEKIFNMISKLKDSMLDMGYGKGFK